MLAALGETGNVRAAVEASGVGRTTHYRWLKEDPEYALAVSAAMEEAADVLEAEARRRAVQGVEEPAGWYKGNPGGYVQKYSDVLLIFLLKGARPDIYRERFEHTGANGTPLDIARQIHDIGQVMRGTVPGE